MIESLTVNQKPFRTSSKLAESNITPKSKYWLII